MLLSGLYDYQTLFTTQLVDNLVENESYVYENGTLALRFHNTNLFTEVLNANTVYNCEMHRDNGYVYLNVNNSQYNYNFGVTNVSGTLKFGHRPTQLRHFEGNIYGFKFLNASSGVELANIIPVKRKEDDVVCFYDSIRDIYLLNSGTGNFVPGPEI